MQYYFAPMEGLTDSIYRRLHSQLFPGISKYYTPFFSPTIHHCLTPKELRELPPSDTLNCSVVPQILTKKSEDFLWMAEQCRDLGYSEVNLNLGCPSGTVTAKGKGSGLLTDPDTLDDFLYRIFTSAPLDVSIKTRLGFSNRDEFPRLIEIFNRYPIKELIIHPRVRNAFYNANVDIEMFHYGLEHSRSPVCYNGNLCSQEQIISISNRFPKINAVMIGRGLIADPGMITPDGTQIKTLAYFYDSLLEEYIESFSSSKNAISRLKEHWHYLICKFDGGEKLAKRLRKTTDLSEYKEITREIFISVPLRASTIPNW